MGMDRKIEKKGLSKGAVAGMVLDNRIAIAFSFFHTTGSIHGHRKP